MGEFTVPTLTAFKANSHVKPSNVTSEHNRNSLESTAFQLPQTKTSTHDESVLWSRQNSDTDPEKALAHHLQVNQPPQNGPLFAYQYKNTHHPLTKLAFIKALATAATKQVLNPCKDMAFTSDQHSNTSYEGSHSKLSKSKADGQVMPS